MCRLTQQPPVRAHRRILARSLQARRMDMRLRMSTRALVRVSDHGIRASDRDHDTPRPTTIARSFDGIRPPGSINARQCHVLACSVYCGARPSCVRSTSSPRESTLGTWG